MTDPLTWVSCFLAFMASQTSHEETRDMAAYAMIIIRLSRKHSGSGWLLYDKQFRQHVTAGSTLPWADINAIITPATGSTMDTVAALRASSSTLALTASRLGTRPRCARSRRGRPRGSQIRRGLPATWTHSAAAQCKHSGSRVSAGDCPASIKLLSHHYNPP